MTPPNPTRAVGPIRSTQSKPKSGFEAGWFAAIAALIRIAANLREAGYEDSTTIYEKAAKRLLLESIPVQYVPVIPKRRKGKRSK